MFDARRFLTVEIGTAHHVRVLFTSYGVKAPDIAAVLKWYSRQAIPGGWLALLICLLEIDGGEPVSLLPYLQKQQ